MCQFQRNCHGNHRWLRNSPAPTGSGSAAAAKHSTKNVVQVHLRTVEPGARTLTKRISLLGTSKSKLVVLLFFLLVIQDFVGILNFLEPRFGGFISRITVGVEFPSQFPIRFLDIILSAGAVDTEHLVGITRHKFWTLCTHG